VCSCISNLIASSVRFLFLYHVTTGDLGGAKEALSKMKYYVTNSEMLHPLLPDE
jgi:hypothetical protein